MTEAARSIPEKSALRLRVEAAKAACDDAGVPLKEVDGLLIMEQPTSSAASNPRHHMEFSEILGLYETPLCATLPVGGATAGCSIDIGRWALQNRRCRYVLCVAGMKASDMGRTTRGHGFTDRTAKLTMHYPDYEWPYGPLMPSHYAVLAQRHMHLYGTTEEQLAAVPVAFRHHASLNGRSVYRTPITVEDVLNSKPISTPLHMLHCCMTNDGAAAFLLTTEERARNLRHKPVLVLGAGQGFSGYWSGFLANGGADKGYSLTTTQAVRAGEQAYGEAGVDPEDIDLFTCLDNFAITPLLLLEDYGFCERGGAGDFVGENGKNITLGGTLPTNTHGGGLSCDWSAPNYLNTIEATLQLRGQADGRQVEGAKLAFVATGAGIASTAAAHVLGTD
jgi:acetyl-CoA acetyltransferase